MPCRQVPLPVTVALTSAPSQSISPGILPRALTKAPTGSFLPSTQPSTTSNAPFTSPASSDRVTPTSALSQSISPSSLPTTPTVQSLLLHDYKLVIMANGNGQSVQSKLNYLRILYDAFSTSIQKKSLSTRICMCMATFTVHWLLTVCSVPLTIFLLWNKKCALNEIVRINNRHTPSP